MFVIQITRFSLHINKTDLPVQPKSCLQGDDLLLFSHVQDVPQVDGGLNHHRLSFFSWRSFMDAVVFGEFHFGVTFCPG